MKLTKESLKQIIKEELDAVMNEEELDEGLFDFMKKEKSAEIRSTGEGEEGKLYAYITPSMMRGDAAVELQYDGKKIDFRYRFVRPQYDPFKIQKAVQGLSASGGKLGSIKGLAEAIFDVLNRKMSSDKPTLEQIRNMKVYLG